MCKSDKKCKAKGYDRSKPEGKWFNDLSILEFRKSLLMPKEIDSLKAFHHRANEFLGRECDQNDPVLPSTAAEARTLGKQLMELHLPGEAEHWLNLAAEEGIPEAQVDYGLALSSVDDHEPSFEEAAKWFEKAASQGSAEGLFQALNIYEGNGYQRLKCTPKHYRTVIKFTPEECGASDEKAEDARRRLTDLADRDVPEAVVWYATEHNDMNVLFDAAERGMVQAMSTLANRYYQQCIACDDPVGEAVRWAEMAAEKGDANSLLGLGLLYRIGFGVEHSPEKAFRYTKQAAKLGLAGGRYLNPAYFFPGKYSERKRSILPLFMTSTHRWRLCAPRISDEKPAMSSKLMVGPS